MKGIADDLAKCNEGLQEHILRGMVIIFVRCLKRKEEEKN